MGDSGSNQPKTRQEHKAQVEQKTSAAAKPSKERRKKRGRIRMFPIWLRLLLLIVSTGIALILGAMVGYGIVGDGQPLDVLDPSTWQHIVDIVVKGTPSS